MERNKALIYLCFILFALFIFNLVIEILIEKETNSNIAHTHKLAKEFPLNTLNNIQTNTSKSLMDTRDKFLQHPKWFSLDSPLRHANELYRNKEYEQSLILLKQINDACDRIVRNEN